MPYLTEFITIAVIHLLAVMSPGPDFAMVVKNSFVYSRRVGFLTAVGLGLSIAVHITYSLIGIGFIISRSVLAFSIIKYIGAAYLIYIGIKALRTKTTSKQSNQKKPTGISPLAAVRVGFLTNLLNPKATLLFFALFTQVINTNTPIKIQLLYGLEMIIMTMVWFSFVAFIISHKAIKQRFAKIQHRLEKAMGAILIALGIKIALSDSR